MTVTDGDSVLAEGDWERWLAERFVAYLLKDANGEQRPLCDVEQALTRLSGQPDALSRLAALAFLLDPEVESLLWLRELLPPFLKRIRVRSEVLSNLERNRIRGRIDWARTTAIRQGTQDPTWIASRSLARTVDTPELVTLRYVLDRIHGTSSTLVRAGTHANEGWTNTVSEIAGAAENFSRHSALRDVPVRRPDTRERSIARASREQAVRHAACLIDIYDALFPEPTIERIGAALARFALSPLNADTRFQVFAMLALVAAIDRVIGPARRSDRIVASGRDEVTRWEGERFVLKLHYDQAAHAGVHANAMRHYFGTSQSLRPDLRLVLELDGISRELIADAKRSTNTSYLADAHHKMRGYIADRPLAFVASMPKAIIVCPSIGVGAPRASDEVVFVGLAASQPCESLDVAIRTWWAGRA